MAEWQTTPIGTTGDFEWRHDDKDHNLVLKLKSTPRGWLCVDAEQLCFLLRQLADKHGVEETLKWLPKS
jgi:hypothetical protein